MGRPAEEGAQDAHDALADDAAGQLLVRGHPVHTAHGGGGQVADGLHGVDHVYDGQRDTGGGYELDLKGHDLGQGEPGGGADAGQIHDTQEVGQDIAHDHTKEDGAQLEDALGEVGQDDHHRQGDQSHHPAADVAEPLGARAAGHVLHSGGIEGQADGEDDGAGDQGREQGTNPLDENTEDDGNDAAYDLSTQDGGDIKFRADGLERGDVRKADTHDDGQAGADASENGEKLEQSGQSG